MDLNGRVLRSGVSLSDKGHRHSISAGKSWDYRDFLRYSLEIWAESQHTLLELSMINHLLSVPDIKFKKAIVILLTLNAVIYAWVDALINAVDELAWLVWLVLYELEANGAAPMAISTLHAIRSVLLAVIVLVFVSYVHDSKWLDVVNSALWFTLIALLELEVRWTDKVFEYRQSYWLATVTVFAGLIAMPITLAWQSAWLDVYDAILWIVAFASIERDIVQLLRRKQA